MRLKIVFLNLRIRAQIIHLYIISENIEILIIHISLQLDKMTEPLAMAEHIGRYKLPTSVHIDFENDEDGVICAICNELEIVSCAGSKEEAKNNLESELRDAIDLYVHVLKESELEQRALQYRQRLAEIERMNEI